jgi:hypothetical protein
MFFPVMAAAVWAPAALPSRLVGISATVGKNFGPSTVRTYSNLPYHGLK